MAGPNDGGDLFHEPDPLPEDIAVIAARSALQSVYADRTNLDTASADIRILLRYIEALEHRLHGLEK